MNTTKIVREIKGHLFALDEISLQWVWAFMRCPEDCRRLFLVETIEGGYGAAIAFAESRYRAKKNG